MTQSPTAPSPARLSPRSLARERFDTLRTVGVGLLVATAFHSVLWQPFTIPSSSMEPGLVTGDYIIASKFPYGWSRASLGFDPPLADGRLLGQDPARGDVVLFRLPRDRRQIWVKRVIGLPGDRVEVVQGAVHINGQPIPQRAEGRVRDHDDPARIVTQVRETLPDGRGWLTYDGGLGSPGDDTAPILVPEGHYLMMGDNRDNSLDGRFPADSGVGLLPAGNIVGRAELVVASWRPGAGLFKPWTWFDLQPGRFFRQVR